MLFNLNAPAAAVHEMERQMRLNEDILRQMTLRVDELEEGPSIQMQGKVNQEERARRRGGDRYDESSSDEGKPDEKAAPDEAKEASTDEAEASTDEAEASTDEAEATKDEAAADGGAEEASADADEGEKE